MATRYRKFIKRLPTRFQWAFFTNNMLIKMGLRETGFEHVGYTELAQGGIRTFSFHDSTGYFDCQVIINNSRKSLYIKMDCKARFNVILPPPSWYSRWPLSKMSACISRRYLCAPRALRRSYGTHDCRKRDALTLL